MAQEALAIPESWLSFRGCEKGHKLWWEERKGKDMPTRHTSSWLCFAGKTHRWLAGQWPSAEVAEQWVLQSICLTDTVRGWGEGDISNSKWHTREFTWYTTMNIALNVLTLFWKGSSDKIYQILILPGPGFFSCLNFFVNLISSTALASLSLLDHLNHRYAW